MGIKDKTINTNSFLNVNNNTAPFVSITWHQKESLNCVVYSHCPTNASYSKCIHGSFLPCNYVTKPFVILQRVIKSQRVLISPYIWTQQKPKSLYLTFQKNLWLNFQTILNFPVPWKGNYPKKFQTTYQGAVFKKKWHFSFLSEESSFLFQDIWVFVLTFGSCSKMAW